MMGGMSRQNSEKYMTVLRADTLVALNMETDRLIEFNLLLPPYSNSSSNAITDILTEFIMLPKLPSGSVPPLWKENEGGNQVNDLL